MKNILLSAAVFALLVTAVSAQKTNSLTDADKAEIIRSILSDRRFDQRHYLSDEDRLVVYLSTENVSQNIVPSKVGESKILLKSPKEIEKKKSEWERYCSFGKFETNGSTASVSFYSYTKDAETEKFHREVLEYEYRKTGGKWEFISRKHPGLRIG